MPATRARRSSSYRRPTSRSFRPRPWSGWPDDPKVEQLTSDWFKAPDLEAQKKLAADIQIEAYSHEFPYVPTGQFVVPTAYRKNVEGVINAPIAFFWNVEKK